MWNQSPHSALKLEKKCNFKSTKTHFLLFQKWQRINFCTRKKFKTIKNAISGLFSGAKIDFLPSLKMKIMCFCTFEIALFSKFRAMCWDEKPRMKFLGMKWRCDKVIHTLTNIPKVSIANKPSLCFNNVLLAYFTQMQK